MTDPVNNTSAQPQPPSTFIEVEETAPSNFNNRP